LGIYNEGELKLLIPGGSQGNNWKRCAADGTARERQLPVEGIVKCGDDVMVENHGSDERVLAACSLIKFQGVLVQNYGSDQWVYVRCLKQGPSISQIPYVAKARENTQSMPKRLWSW